MKCKVPGCGAKTNYVFCHAHGTEWETSPERERAKRYDNTDSMLFAFARRMELDGFRKPGLKHIVDTQPKNAVSVVVPSKYMPEGH